MESNLCSFLLHKTHSCSLLSPHQVRVTMEPCLEEQGAPPKNSHINQLGQEARCAPSFPSAEYSVSHTIYITAFQWPPCWLARWDRHSWSLIPLTNLIRTIRFHLAQRSKSVLFCPLANAICGSPAYSATGSKYKCPWEKAGFVVR